MKDIETRDDVKQLVHTFYDQVQKDPILADAFNVVAQVDWESHLPVMVSFWATIIFRRPGYKGDPFLVHRQLGQKMELTPHHFTHWVTLFQQTVDNLFTGSRADFAKQSATQMGNGLIHNLFERPSSIESEGSANQPQTFIRLE